MYKYSIRSGRDHSLGIMGIDKQRLPDSNMLYTDIQRFWSQYIPPPPPLPTRQLRNLTRVFLQSIEFIRQTACEYSEQSLTRVCLKVHKLDYRHFRSSSRSIS